MYRIVLQTMNNDFFYRRSKIWIPYKSIASVYSTEQEAKTEVEKVKQKRKKLAYKIYIEKID